MNKLISIIFIFIYFLLPSTISAHILETSSDIGAVLHIEPDDDPYAKIPSQIYFDIKDKSNRFNFISCECVFTVEVNDKKIHSQKALSESITYTFPEKGIYKISLEGRPIDSGNFTAFKLTYDIRVSREPDQIDNTKKNYLPIIFSTIFLFVFILLILKFKNKGVSVILILGLSTNLFTHIFFHHQNSTLLTKKQDCCLLNVAVVVNSTPLLIIPELSYEQEYIDLNYVYFKRYFHTNSGRSPPTV